MGIGRLQVILKRFVVWNIVERREPSHGCVIGSADRRAVGIPSSRAKAAMEPSPGDAVLVEQIADISPRQCDEILAAGQAVSRAGRGLPIMVPSTTCVFRLPVSSTTLSPWVWPSTSP